MRELVSAVRSHREQDLGWDASSGHSVKGYFSYFVVILVTVLILANTYGLWTADLSSPIQDVSGDSNINLYIVKALNENAYPHNARVGAPFGFDYNDMHQPDLLHFLVLKALVASTGNIVLTLNLYYLLGFILIAMSAFYVLRRFQFSVMASLLCAELYAFTPSHLWRSMSHLFLSEYYLLPLVVLLCVELLTDLPATRSSFVAPAGVWQERVTERPPLRVSMRRIIVFGLPLAVLVGAGGVYYAFYSVLFLSTAAFCAAFRPGRKAYSVLGFSCAAIIVLTVVVGMTPIFQYRHQHGRNLQAVTRSVVDTEVFSLKISDLYLPTPLHPIKKLRELSAQYNGSLPIMNDNESEFSSLGLLGAIGFTALLLWPLLNVVTDRTGGVMRVLVTLNLVGILYAVTEGFGTLFSFLITPEIRCNNRLVFFIAFFALGGLAYLVDVVTAKVPRLRIIQIAWFAGMFVLLWGGLYDEGVTQVIAAQAPLKNAYNSDEDFIKKLESLYPAGGSILQLPYQPFPEGAGPYHLRYYEPLRAYIHSSRLSWSFPSMRGRATDEWIRDLSSSPAGELVRKAVSSGFGGILIDRNGYQDAGASLEAQLQAILGKPPLVNNGRDLSFFSLSEHANDIKARTLPSDWQALTSRSTAVPKVILVPASGFYPPDNVGGEEWQWCDRKGVLGISDQTSKPLPITLTGRLTSGNSSTSTIVFRSSTQEIRLIAPPTGRDFRWDLTVQPGVNRLDFDSNATPVIAPYDPRSLYFRMEKLKVQIR